MQEIIIDTCVLLDIFVSSRPRHKIADLLANKLISGGIKAKIPFFALFELHSGINNIRLEKGAIFLNPKINKERKLNIHRIPIDDAFLQKYLDPTLPYSTAGDLLFLSMARKDKLPLITEDKNLYEKAKTANIEVYKIDEYLACNN